MRFTLELDFSGLMAFVPVDGGEGLVDDVDQAKAVWVLAVDARTPNPAKDRDGMLIDTHRAAVRFRNANFVSAPENWVRQSLVADGSRSWFYLEEVDLTLQGGPGSNPSALAVNRDDYALLPSLQEIDPAVTIPKSRWSGPLANEPVVLRLKLDSGALGLSLPINGAHEVDFDPAGQWSRRSIASQMTLRIVGLEDSVTLSSPAGDLVFGPDPACVGGCTVKVEILNSPSHDFMANGHSHKNSSARHFELFWNLVQGGRRSRPAPVLPHPPAGVVGPMTSPDLLCPEVRP